MILPRDYMGVKSTIKMVPIKQPVGFMISKGPTPGFVTLKSTQNLTRLSLARGVVPSCDALAGSPSILVIGSSVKRKKVP